MDVALQTDPPSAAPTDAIRLQLWYGWPADLSEDGIEAACAALVNDAERERAARFRFDRHRCEYLASHALARNALSYAYPLPPHAWSYSVNPYGKPSPLPECGLHFNQSNSMELAVCLVAAYGTEASLEAGPEVGVDVEAFSRAEQIVPLAPKVFSLAEQAQLNALPAAERLDRALSLWTLKEAYIKARGMGLALPLRGVSFLFGEPQGIRLEVDPGVDSNPSRWRFCLLEHVQHRIALAVEAAAPGNTKIAGIEIPDLEVPKLEVFAARPPFAAPTRLPSGSETWFPLLTAAFRSHALG
jgi:4'-phosphopantetheinyl transferase